MVHPLCMRSTIPRTEGTGGADFIITTRQRFRESERSCAGAAHFPAGRRTAEGRRLIETLQQMVSDDQMLVNSASRSARCFATSTCPAVAWAARRAVMTTVSDAAWWSRGLSSAWQTCSAFTADGAHASAPAVWRVRKCLWSKMSRIGRNGCGDCAGTADDADSGTILNVAE